MRLQIYFSYDAVLMSGTERNINRIWSLLKNFARNEKNEHARIGR